MNMDSFKLLITNYHIISEEKLNEPIKLEMHNKKVKILSVDENLRFIEFYKHPLDITVIQINDKDVIENVDFLDYDINYSQGYTQYNEENIFASGYPFGKKIVTVSGHIIGVYNSFEFRLDIWSYRNYLKFINSTYEYKWQHAKDATMQRQLLDPKRLC